MSHSLWQDLRDAIKGTEADYTQIPLKRAIFLLAVPMILELVMESTFALVDIYFVGKLGHEAVATVGLTETIMFILYAVGMGLAMGVTAIVARRIGEKHQAEASITAIQAIFLSLIVSAPFTVIGLFFSKDALALMGASAWALDHGYRYTAWMLGGNVVIMLLFVINAIYRGAGDAAIAMRVLWVANLINIALDPALIFGWGPLPAFGVEGAAIATNIGRGVGVLMQVYVLFRGGKHIRVAVDQLRWNGAVVMNIIRTSVGGVGQMIVAMTSWIFLMRILAGIGSEAVAASTTVIRVMMFTMMPAWGMSNAAATLVGQNLGAGLPERAERSVWLIGLYNMVFLIAISVAYFIFREDIIAIFSNNANVIAIGAEWLRILSFSYFVYGWWMVSVQAFNGAGDTRTPTWINIFFFWLFQIPLSYFLAIQLGWSHSGVFWGVFISETGVGLFTLYLFSRGRWKLATV